MKTHDRVELDKKITDLEEAEGILTHLRLTLSKNGYISADSDFYIPVLEQLDALSSALDGCLDQAYVEKARDDRRKAAP